MSTKISKRDSVLTSENLKSSEPKNENVKPLSNNLKYFTAAAIFYGNIVFGCGFTTYGLALTSLQTKYNVDDSTISTVFTFLTCGSMTGGLAAGIIFNYVNRQLAVIISFLTMSAVMFITPHCSTLTTFFMSATVMGICGGCYDVAQIVWMMEMMQKKCPPFVLAQHFFWGVGTILSSLIVAPFLKHDDQIDYEFNLVTPYTIIGFLIGFAAVAHTLLFVFMRYAPPPPEVLADTEIFQVDTNVSNKTNGIRIGKWSLQKLRIVVLAAIFLGAYIGMEVCTFEFFSKFGQNSNLKLSEKNAAYTLTGMTTAYATGRGIGIIVAMKISPHIIVCVNIALVSLANIILIGWASNSLPALWCSSILFGVGFSTMFPAFCAYIERYLKFTNSIGSFMVVCSSITAGVYPLIIGRFIEDNPVVLSYTTFCSITLVLVTFGTLSFLTLKNKTRY